MLKRRGVGRWKEDALEGWKVGGWRGAGREGRGGREGGLRRMRVREREVGDMGKRGG
jgi:hypothetical protein